MSRSTTVRQLTIRTLNQDELTDAVATCALAMRDNPLHIKVFGRAEQKRHRRLRRFFPGMLAYVERKGWLYGAFIEQRLVGVFGVIAPGHCTPSLTDSIRLVPYMVSSNGVVGLLRLGIWLGSWAKLNPRTPHWHLGPLAVDPAWQGQGIGWQLLEYVIEQTHKAEPSVPLYLETDKEENVRYYTKFGFYTVGTPMILGTQSWLMLRQKGAICGMYK